MDLLFKRYASPFPFLDTMIQAGRFSEFVGEFYNLISKETEEKTTWEFFLHKTWGYEGSYNDFLQQLKNDQTNQGMTAGEIETTVMESLDILNGYAPKQGGG